MILVTDFSSILNKVLYNIKVIEMCDVKEICIQEYYAESSEVT
jgi:hypothetical protein